MRKLFRTIRKRITQRQATAAYINAAKMAEKRFAKTGKPQYVISSPQNELNLMVTDKDEFLAMRHALSIKSKDLTLQQLRRCCWYRTANKNGMDPLSAKEVMRRKNTFAIMALESRGLLEK